MRTCRTSANVLFRKAGIRGNPQVKTKFGADSVAPVVPGQRRRVVARERNLFRGDAESIEQSRRRVAIANEDGVGAWQDLRSSVTQGWILHWTDALAKERDWKTAVERHFEQRKHAQREFHEMIIEQTASRQEDNICVLELAQETAARRILAAQQCRLRAPETQKERAGRSRGLVVVSLRPTRQNARLTHAVPASKGNRLGSGTNAPQFFRFLCDDADGAAGDPARQALDCDLKHGEIAQILTIVSARP